ncbi:phosphopentomutase [Geothermobacter hydrogeniphilus]|uniref:Phosphopentomutase n=1 Tax=Geothermobacter hydrogeniphilus TaxID=1969733 RepID=A0A1X0Y5Q3_9BACT|nr:phosphopentomutase [Geothermobacter hydrogeniphilus]ORJ60521.1 phosphopentomutase [Geothermobacter hydrogeniphilus]
MNPPFRRVLVVVLDGVGVGALPDAAAYGDAGANTLLHVLQRSPSLRLPNFERFGLGRLVPAAGLVSGEGLAACGRMAEKAAGKDSTAGHWELMGVTLEQPLPTYPQGFPEEIISAFTAATGLAVLGNRAASGTDIIRDLGEEHLRSGLPIIYTSSDSVFQIAAHEEVIPVEKLYDLCRKARELLNPFRVGRVIARPFTGRDAAGFRRTAGRHDFSLPPIAPTLLDRLQQAGVPVVGIGKIGDLFAGRGLDESLTTASNADGMAATLECLERVDNGLIIVNLVDFDMLWGHRLDVSGFADGLAAVDAWLPQLTARLRSDDLLLITADHGCDPTTPGTDHSREYVPLLAWFPGLRPDIDLGTRAGFADVAATVGEALGCTCPAGRSFLPELKAGRV